jgi:hypothetical protein
LCLSDEISPKEHGLNPYATFPRNDVMKIHQVSRAQLQFLKLSPTAGIDLCVYEAEQGDDWRGFVAAGAGWTGAGMLPDRPSLSFGLALYAWVSSYRLLSGEKLAS